MIDDQQVLAAAKRIAFADGFEDWDCLGPHAREDYLTFARAALETT